VTFTLLALLLLLSSLLFFTQTLLLSFDLLFKLSTGLSSLFLCILAALLLLRVSCLGLAVRSVLLIT
jgi:hypothetical protein